MTAVPGTTQVSRKNHTLDGDPDPHAKWQFSGGKRAVHCKVKTVCHEPCKNG